MGYDPFSPIAPALINVLCVPAGRITPASFHKHVKWLQGTAAIAAVQEGSETPQSAEVPDSNSGSVLLFNFSSYADRTHAQQTTYFEPNRQTQLVLGILDDSALRGQDHQLSVADVLASAQSQLADFVQKAYGVATPTRLLAFDVVHAADYNETICLSAAKDSAVSPALTKWLAEAATSRLTSALEVLRTSDVVLPRSDSASDKSNGAGPVREMKTEDARRQSVISTPTQSSTQTMPVAEVEVQASISSKTISAALLKLQMGLWTEALDQLADGARAARESINPAWHAKALEGILVCLLLHAWAGKEFLIPQNCYPTNRGLSSSSAVHAISDANRSVSERFAGSSTHRLQALTAMLPGLLATILNLYDRSAFGFDNGLPRILICEARVRLAVLLAKIKRHGSLINVIALDDICGDGGILRANRSIEPATVPLVLRSSLLASLLIESVTEAQANLQFQAASSVCFVICQQLADLRLERKQGLYLKDILQKLPPILMEARRLGAAGVAAHPSANVSSMDNTTAQSARGVRSLLRMAVLAYNLPDFQRLRCPTGEHVSETSQAQQRLSSWLSLYLSGDIAPKLEVLRLCIRVCDALPDLFGSIQFMSLLLFSVRQSITLSPASVNAVPLIAAEEQTRLSTGISNAVSAAQRDLSEPGLLADYWDDFMVRDISVYEPASTGKLVPHASSDLSLTTTSGTNKKDPFIYNPFSADAKSSGPAILVKDEIASFDVLLQNPLEIDIEVETISLLSEGCIFEPLAHSVMIGPLCAQVFTLQGTPKGSGLLKIVGCRAKIKNCHEQDFPIFCGQWKPPIITKRKQINQEINIELPEIKTLKLKVVDPLPQLRISSSTLVQPSVMLLDGEKCRFGITLENPGTIPVDLVLFSYEDSVSKQLQEALTTKDLQPADMYELQYQLTHRSGIRRIHQQNSKLKSSYSAVSIPAHSQETFEFEILGKPGLREATILIDYAYLGKPRSEVEGTFYTRQLKYTVHITVNGSVDIHRCAVLSTPEPVVVLGSTTLDHSKISAANDQDVKSSKKRNLGQCLLQLDLRSIWQSPITVTIETTAHANSDSDREWTTATTATLLPAQYTRTLILYSRIYIASPHEPIPSLSQNTRQFVVSSSKLSLEAEMASREVFWYREEVCKRLRITWQEEYGDRKRRGEIDVRRGIRLSPRMIDVLRVEHIQFSFDLVPERNEDSVQVVIQKRGGEFTVRRNTFAKLIMKVHNLTQEDLRLLSRLQPSLHDQPHNVAMDLSKKFVWTGVLQKALKSSLKAGEVATSELGIVGLAAGVYEVNATVEEVCSKKREVDGVAGGNSERRIWHARRPALIRVVDA